MVGVSLSGIGHANTAPRHKPRPVEDVTSTGDSRAKPRRDDRWEQVRGSVRSTRDALVGVTASGVDTSAAALATLIHRMGGAGAPTGVGNYIDVRV